MDGGLHVINFLVIVDYQGFIRKVKWTTEEGVIYEGKSLLLMLGTHNEDKILNSMQKSLSGDDYDCFTLHVNTEDDDIIQLSLSLIRMENYVVAIGISGWTGQNQMVNQLVSAYNDLVNELRKEIKYSVITNEESVRKEFEELQKLNNELSNTMRKIEKANSRLNNLNQELQDRLARDPLTGLIGRYQYWVGIRSMIENNPGKLGIFLFIDIDDFKDINDTYGHAAGDQFLVEIGKRLESIPLKECMIIRISGDEFGLFIYNYESEEEVDTADIWEMIQKYVLSSPVVFNDIPITISVSAGMAIYGVDTENVEEMIEYADFAMYQAKRKGKNQYREYNEALYESKMVKQTQSRAVNQVLENEDLYHVFQPIVPAIDGYRKVFAYSAQMRTKNDFFKDTQDLIVCAFQESRYQELDALSFNKLINERKLFEQLEGESLFISHGSYSLKRSQLLGSMKENFINNEIVIEIVEGQMASFETIESLLNAARTLGFKVAIKDFGTGKLNDLEFLTVEPHFIKISRKLTGKINKHAKNKKIVNKIVQYAHTQGTKVIMEGIETKKEMETSIQLGVDYLQGYYLGVPALEAKK